jgi:eukaryotic-like serine/threonine-protein kinase
MVDVMGGPLGPDVRVAGRYLLLEQIGAGGMGRVFHAHDELLDRDVAVKILDSGETEGQAWIAEARAAAKLSHPGIVQVFDTGVHEDRGFIVTELLPGRTLYDLLTERRTIEPSEAIEIVARLAGALEDAHRHGVIHCDIKPLNIIITPEGVPKLVDFGIARSATIAGDSGSEMIAGSAPYVAPEQASGEPVDGRADIYALGAVLYEMLTGRPPFEGRNAAAVMQQRLVVDPSPPRSLNPAVSLELEQVVLRSLARDPTRRYPRAADFRDALSALAATAREPTIRMRSAVQVAAAGERTIRTRPAAQAVSASRSASTRAPRFRSRRPHRLLITGLALLLGAMLIAFLGGPVGRSVSGAKQVAVPALVGKRLADVPTLLEQASLAAGPVQTQTVEPARAGTVIEQDPPPGQTVAAGGEVRFVVGVPR